MQARTDVRQAPVGASARDSPTGEVADRLHAPAGTGASGLATGAGAQGSRGVGPDVSAACPGRLTRDLRSRFTLIPVSSSSPGCSFLPLRSEERRVGKGGVSWWSVGLL